MAVQTVYFEAPPASGIAFIREQKSIMDGKIRPPFPGDLGRIISMHGEIYAQEFRFEPDFEIDIAAKVVDYYKNTTSFDTFWIYEIDGTCAGSIAVSKKSEATAFLNFMLVSLEFRRRGIAQSLLNTAIQHTISNNFNSLWLETYSCLKDARKLYRKTGFRLTESTPNISKFGRTFDRELWELILSDS